MGNWSWISTLTLRCLIHTVPDLSCDRDFISLRLTWINKAGFCFPDCSVVTVTCSTARRMGSRCPITRVGCCPTSCLMGQRHGEWRSRWGTRSWTRWWLLSRAGMSPPAGISTTDPLSLSCACCPRASPQSVSIGPRGHSSTWCQSTRVSTALCWSRKGGSFSWRRCWSSRHHTKRPRTWRGKWWSSVRISKKTQWKRRGRQRSAEVDVRGATPLYKQKGNFIGTIVYYLLTTRVSCVHRFTVEQSNSFLPLGQPFWTEPCYATLLGGWDMVHGVGVFYLCCTW